MMVLSGQQFASKIGAFEASVAVNVAVNIARNIARNMDARLQTR